MHWLVKMWCLLTLCPVLFAAGVQTLSIHTQLGTSIEDCFERIAIGEQLPSSAIYRNVSELTTRECEQICKQDKQCQAYDYGVGAKGNATCNLSNISEKDVKAKDALLRHPDYDVYIRRFQCEQSPPSPLQPLQDELQGENPGPTHRPIFRPDDDAKRPLADEVFQDSRPFETKPDYRPYPQRPHNHFNQIDRPDDYFRPDDYNQRPSIDLPPSYGIHKPQTIPFRPESPYSNHSGPYDVLQFDGPGSHPYWRPGHQYPPRPNDENMMPYGHRPDLPPYGTEKPEFVYITRPTRKPFRPHDDSGAPGYGNKPSRPVDFPSHSHDRPNYEYNSQYASSYGQNQYNDNSIYLEIFDPPRPHKPMNDRPTHGGSYEHGSHLGYGSYGGPSNYDSYNQNSQSNYYGASNSQYDNYNKPLDQVNKPYRPNNRPNPGYGLEDSHQPEKPYNKPSSGYGPVQDHNDYKPAKPSYGPSNPPAPGYGPTHNQDSLHKPTKPSYGSSDPPSSGYGSPQPQDHIGYKPQKPDYGVSTSGYGSGSNHLSSGYGSSQSSYADQSYGSQSGYGSQMTQKPQNVYPEPGYNEKPLYSNRPPYNYNQGPYGAQGSYGSQTNDFNQGYGSSQFSYGSNYQSSYGNQYGDYQSSYDGGYRPFNDVRPGYGPPPYNNGPSSNRPIYGDLPSYNDKPNKRPSYSRPPYDDKPSYGEDSPYGNRPVYIKPSYNDKPSYGENKPTTEEPSYQKPSYDDPGYDNNRPDGELGAEDSGGYKNTGKVNQTGYNANKPDIKPVYEYELDKPHNVPSYIARPSGEVITSRPVTIGDYGNKPAYGREPPVSYKACFRRVLAGKRAVRSFVRKVVPCERLEDCRRECAEERRFHCESFNYRLDPSFRGKGLCEMMTKPIEAFNLRRDFVEDKDYDFYELDRNSLEPYCPETLRGPGLLHSGYLSSKTHMESFQAPSGGGWNRNDWYDRDDRNQFYNDRNFGGNYGGGRRHEDEPFFVPYQIGGLARSNDDQESWGQYGGTYGHSYYKDRNDHHKSINYWGLNELQPPLLLRPHENQNFNYYDLGKKVDRYGYGGWKRGRFGGNTPGPSHNGLDYGESSYFKPPKPVYYESGESEERSDEIVVKDCSSRRRPGMSLGSGAIRRSLNARTVVQCEAACFNEREFKCVSYSYRYSSSHGSDNCFLSERPYRGLELSQDSGSDVYAMPEDHGCSAVSTKPFVESECFWHVRSGKAVSGTAIRAKLTVAGLGACEAECIRAHTFFCRGFSFRFDAATVGEDLENCLLTSTPPTSLGPGRGLRPSPPHELYARGNYGRGCEPALYDDMPHTESGECYLQYDNAAKLIGAAIKGSAKVRDEQSCGKACTDAPFRCLSFSYNNNAPPDSDNCLLSEIRLFDLQRGVDYEHSTDDWLFAFDLFNGQCWRKVHGKEDTDSPVAELPRPLSPHEGLPSGLPGPFSPEHSGPSGPTGSAELPYIPGSGPSGPSYKPYPEPRPSHPGPGYLPAEPPGYLPKPSGPGYREPSGPYRPVSGPSGRPSGPAYLPSGPPVYSPSGPFRPSHPGVYRPDPPSGPYRPSGPPDRPGRPGYPDTAYGPPLPGPPGAARPGYPGQSQPDRPREEPISVSWRHYTVSGFPCRAGTACAQNQVAGHWSCEPEGGEIGAWDYCCAPTHRCGYSEGFHKPWCYVGHTKDQWRPCSEKYYPYHQHNVPHPSQSQRGPSRPPSGPPGRPGPLGPPSPLGPPGPRPGSFDRPDLSYLPEADRRYWDDLYKNGPQAYYDKYGNPLPGYTRVPTEERPYIKYSHNEPQPGSGMWVPLHSQEYLDPPVPGGLGAPRYWPVAYLHKSPPPNTTYFKYNNTEQPFRENSRDPPTRQFSRNDVPREPSRDFNRDDDRKFDRDENRNFDRDQNRNFNRNENRNFDRDENRNENRNFNRDENRNFNRDENRNFDRDQNRNTNRDPSRKFDRADTRDLERELPSDNDRNKHRDYPREPTRDRTLPNERPPPSFTRVDPDRPSNNNIDKKHRDDKTMNITNIDETNFTEISKNITSTTTTTTPKTEIKADEDKLSKTNATENIEADEKMDAKELDSIKGIDDKIDDFSKSIEVLDIEDAKGEKLSDLKTLEAEERQIEAIGRLLASRRGSQLVLEKRSQKDLEAKSTALDKELVDFNFGNRFPTSNVERRGIVQRVTKEELARERLMDKSLEVSETTFVRPPRVLSTTDNIRKAIVNGKVFYSANLRDQRDINNTRSLSLRKDNNLRNLNVTRKAKSLNMRPLEERAPSILKNANYGQKKIVRARNVNPVRKVRRVYRRKYNPDEVRKRLLEREKSMKENVESKKA